MAPWHGPPSDGIDRRGGEDQGRSAQREQDQGGRDEEASQRGRCRSGRPKAAAELIEHCPMISCHVIVNIIYDIIDMI